jgi:hypothetical protein
LEDALRRRFAEEHVPAEVSSVILESVQNEADVVRLSLGEGSPLDTFRTELTNYRVNHEHASTFRRLLKYISLLPALFLSPRHYNSFKQKVASNSLYARARGKFLPFHRPHHVDRTGDWNL